MNMVVNNAVAASVVVTVAAGNENTEAATRSPASAASGACSGTACLSTVQGEQGEHHAAPGNQTYKIVDGAKTWTT